MTQNDIIDAYGVYWDLVKEYVDNEGWARTNQTGLIDAYYEHNTGNPIEFEKHPIRRWRPLVLKYK